MKFTQLVFASRRMCLLSNFPARVTNEIEPQTAARSLLCLIVIYMSITITMTGDDLSSLGRQIVIFPGASSCS